MQDERVESNENDPAYETRPKYVGQEVGALRYAS